MPDVMDVKEGTANGEAYRLTYLWLKHIVYLLWRRDVDEERLEALWNLQAYFHEFFRKLPEPSMLTWPNLWEDWHGLAIFSRPKKDENSHFIVWNGPGSVKKRTVVFVGWLRTPPWWFTLLNRIMWWEYVFHGDCLVGWFASQTGDFCQILLAPFGSRVRKTH